MARIFISPSTQEHNAYAGGGNEEQYMRVIAWKVTELLAAAGHTVKLGGEVSAGTNAGDANTWGAEWYVACHSNAGGGHGTECWFYPGSTRGAALANSIYDHVAPASNEPDRGVKSSAKYIELYKPNAPACIVEVAFHDCLAEANEIRNEPDKFAVAIAKGVCGVAGGSIPVTPPPVVVPPPVVTPPPVVPPAQHVCQSDPHPSDANEQIAAYEARETKALALARELVTLLSA